MGSCNENCGNCGVPIGLFSIIADAYVFPSAFGCVNGDPLPEGTLGYTSYTSNRAGGSNSSENLSCFWHLGGDTYVKETFNSSYNNNGASNYIYTIRSSVDQYGRYIETASASSRINATTNYKSDGEAWYGEPGPCSMGSTSYKNSTNINCKLVECDFNQCEVAPCNYFVCEENCSTSSNETTCIDGVPGSNNDSNNGCGGFPSCAPSEGSCTSIKCSASESSQWQNPYPELPTCYSANSSSNSKGTDTVSSIMTLGKAKGFSMSSVNKRLAILASNSNQNPCGDNCGIGDDDCWGGGFEFTPVDNTNNSYYSRIKVKVAASVEDMKPYSNIQGTVYFYEDSTPGCCGEGEPVFTSNFSLDSQGNFKDGTMVARDVYNFENDSMQDYVGSTIVACIKINGVNIN